MDERKLLRITDQIPIILGVLILGLSTPQAAAKTEYSTIKYEKREYPALYASYSPQIEKKPLIDYKSLPANVLKHYPSKLGFNCVVYARSRKEIPQNLYSLKSKIANIKTQKPSIGAVGVTAEGGYSGHLVVVEEVRENSVVVSDGNFHRGYVTIRELPKEKIIGYM